MQVSKNICAMSTVVLVNLCLYPYFVLVYCIVYWIIPNCMLKNLVRTTPGLNAGSATGWVRPCLVGQGELLLVHVQTTCQAIISYIESVSA
jgi:hypothetical protein